ncbi:hypothetical protein [Devosia nitrariae]|uniref:Uncharacterized protein n=1 Tax=Devosia nitrariae TaxID=2071872 RepID=A0ABQ5W1B5_9HYPH|nr:hypothetical protein [Devosia nitrariae]GLQ53470.1 hypothetical protein GCM10010862_07290 [Devosia nitrariae]
MMKHLAALAAVLAGTFGVAAGEGGDILASTLANGDHAAGLESLQPLIAADDSEASFAAGALTVVDGIEAFVQAMYRHGLTTAPDIGMAGAILGVPMTRSVIANPDPEPLDYEGLRAILTDLVTAMDGGRDLLAAAGKSGDYVVPVDILTIRIDANGDGVADDSETIGAALALQLGINPSDLLGPGKSKSKNGESTAQGFIIGFDRADAFWLAGYTQVVAAQADLLLAHDFEEMFNSSFHRIFPQAGLPMQEYSRGGTLMMDPESDAAIADAVAFIHTFNFEVVDVDRLHDVRARLKSVVAFSRQNWEAILAETDDERELVPSPAQTSIIPDVAVTQEVVDAWMETLDSVEAIIEGELLIPHWRFRQGFDLRAYFETATRTDAVMIFTGYGALPFLKDGPIADAQAFRQGLAVFGENFPGFALWFN